jgi:hypothetical protein
MTAWRTSQQKKPNDSLLLRMMLTRDRMRKTAIHNQR